MLNRNLLLISTYRSRKTSLADEHVIMFASVNIFREFYRPSPRSLLGAEPISVEKYRQEKVPVEKFTATNKCLMLVKCLWKDLKDLIKHDLLLGWIIKSVSSSSSAASRI